MDDGRDTVTINSILTTSDQAYSKTDLNSDTLEKEDGDETGPFDLGVSITETLDDLLSESFLFGFLVSWNLSCLDSFSLIIF